MKKTLLTLLAISATVIVMVSMSKAQISPDPTLTMTNNVKVSLNTNDDAALRLAWRLDSNSRTNGIAPYTTNGPALLYLDWLNWQATQAFHDIAVRKGNENEAYVLNMYRFASDTDRAKVARILAGLTN